MLKDFVDGGLASAGRAHKHDTEADIECLEQLNSLKDEHLVSLKLENVNGLLNLGQELTIVGVGNLDSWEQVLDDGRKEGQIILQELGDVGVTHGTDEHSILIKGGVGSLEGTGHHKHGLDCSHTEIVVVLLRELL